MVSGANQCASFSVLSSNLECVILIYTQQTILNLLNNRASAHDVKLRELEINNRPILGRIFVRIQGVETGASGYVTVTTTQKTDKKTSNIG